MLFRVDLPGVFGALVELAFLAVCFVAIVAVVRKAGYSGWWALLALVPLLNVVMFLVFAFRRWPVLREVRETPDPRTGAPRGSVIAGIE